MTDPESPEAEQSTTAWHPMLVALLEFYLPAGWRLHPELLLNRLPRRVDIVILRRIGEAAGAVRKIHSIFDYLRPHTLIEHKGPTDDLEPGDALTLLGYAAQYMRLAKVSDPKELCLMVVCDHIPPGFVAQVKRMRGTLAAAGNGLWRGEIAGMLLHGVETRKACRASPSEHMLYTFSSAYLKDPRGLRPLDEEEDRVYVWLSQQVAQFRKNRGDMTIRDLQLAEECFEEVMAKEVKSHPRILQKLMPTLTPKQRLKGLSPEQRIEGLTPEEILSALPPEVVKRFAKKLGR
jgi:hypothetical protein